MKLRALDLFCGAGGSSAGLRDAGYEVTAVDIEPQPNHPAGVLFVQSDALTFPLGGYDLIWASPPCQAYSTLNAYNRKTYPDLIAAVRGRLALEATGLYVIENVMQAPLLKPVMLCGAMFGLRVYRHRNFEASWPLRKPCHPEHLKKCARNGYLPNITQNMTITGGKHSEAWRECASDVMGVPWMKTIREVCESIPPAYSEFIGRAAIVQIQRVAA